jgi:hypothetical protein
MSLEPFVYLFVFLVLTALVLIGRWLNEKVREEINLRDLFSPSETPDRARPETPTFSRQEVRIPPAERPRPRNRRMRLKMALHNKRDLRQGIVLMTVLGPCRALDPPSF